MTLEVDRPSPSVRLLTLNRPDRMNAMTAELCGALHAELACPRLIGASRAHELMLEDRQQIMALHGAAPQEALSAFLEKRAASFAD